MTKYLSAHEKTFFSLHKLHFFCSCLQRIIHVFSFCFFHDFKGFCQKERDESWAIIQESSYFTVSVNGQRFTGTIHSFNVLWAAQDVTWMCLRLHCQGKSHWSFIKHWDLFKSKLKNYLFQLYLPVYMLYSCLLLDTWCTAFCNALAWQVLQTTGFIDNTYLRLLIGVCETRHLHFI